MIQMIAIVNTKTYNSHYKQFAHNSKISNRKYLSRSCNGENCVMFCLKKKCFNKLLLDFKSNLNKIQLILGIPLSWGDDYNKIISFQVHKDNLYVPLFLNDKTTIASKYSNNRNNNNYDCGSQISKSKNSKNANNIIIHNKKILEYPFLGSGYTKCLLPWCNDGVEEFILLSNTEMLNVISFKNVKSYNDYYRYK